MPFVTLPGIKVSDKNALTPKTMDIMDIRVNFKKDIDLAQIPEIVAYLNRLINEGVFAIEKPGETTKLGYLQWRCGPIKVLVQTDTGTTRVLPPDMPVLPFEMLIDRLIEAHNSELASQVIPAGEQYVSQRYNGKVDHTQSQSVPGRPLRQLLDKTAVPAALRVPVAEPYKFALPGTEERYAVETNLNESDKIKIDAAIVELQAHYGIAVTGGEGGDARLLKLTPNNSDKRPLSLEIPEPTTMTHLARKASMENFVITASGTATHHTLEALLKAAYEAAGAEPSAPDVRALLGFQEGNRLVKTASRFPAVVMPNFSAEKSSHVLSEAEQALKNKIEDSIQKAKKTQRHAAAWWFLGTNTTSNTTNTTNTTKKDNPNKTR